MACCNNPGTTLVFGHPMPNELNQLSAYKSEIEAGLVMVDVMVRTEPNGPLKSIKCQIQRHVADSFKSAVEEISQNPTVAFIWGGSYCFRGMNNGSSNPKASIHSLGLAFDVNVSYNPYARDSYPDDAFRMRTDNHPIVKAFKRQGWVWGGNWERPDYMHFEFSSGAGEISPGDDFQNAGYSQSFDSPAFSASSSSYSGNNTSTTSPAGTVYRLASTGERDDVLLQDEARRGQFESLRKKLLDNALEMGREVIVSTELYDPSIIKQAQSAKEIRS